MVFDADPREAIVAFDDLTLVEVSKGFSGLFLSRTASLEGVA